MDATSRFGWLTWNRFLALGVVAVVVRVSIPSQRAGQAFVVLVTVLSTGAVWVGVSRLRAGDRRPALWFAAALTVYLAGDLVFYFHLLVEQSPRPFPSLADLLYLVDLPMFIVAFVLFIRRQSPERDIASLIDGTLVAVAGGLLSWMYVIEPILASSSTPLPDRLVGVAYPVLDLILLTMAVGLLLLPGRRPVAYALLVAGVVSLASADTLYNLLNTLPGLPLAIEPYYGLWMVWYLLAGAAMLHPTMASGTPASGGSAPELDGWRLGILGTVVLVAPLLVIIESEAMNRRHLQVIGVASAALFVLVVARMRLIQRSLRHARAEAVAANEAKSLFLATMSHEMRTPLNAVLGFAGALMESDLDAQQRDWAETVVSSGQALVGVISDILDFTKIESGYTELASAPFGVGACVRSALAVVAPAAEVRGLELDHHIGPEVPAVVLGDAARLRQVLVNLLSNGVTHTDAGRVSVEVGFTGTHLHFAVSDTGTGIPPAARADLFEPFFQVAGPRTYREGGSGLGLAICRRLCELMGGSISVESEEGVGSTFSFTVAVAVAPAGEVAAPATSWAGERGGPAGFRALQVLVAEDNPVNQRVALLFLERLGHRADVVADGREVLRAVESTDYDVVLMDMRMPEMDGLAASRHVIDRRSADGRPRIVGVTANAVAGDRERCLASGMDGYLSKPFSLADLAGALAGLWPEGRSPAP